MSNNPGGPDAFPWAHNLSRSRNIASQVRRDSTWSLALCGTRTPVMISTPAVISTPAMLSTTPAFSEAPTPASTFFTSVTPEITLTPTAMVASSTGGLGDAAASMTTTMTTAEPLPSEGNTEQHDNKEVHWTDPAKGDIWALVILSLLVAFMVVMMLKNIWNGWRWGGWRNIMHGDRGDPRDRIAAPTPPPGPVTLPD